MTPGDRSTTENTVDDEFILIQKIKKQKEELLISPVQDILPEEDPDYGRAGTRRRETKSYDIVKRRQKAKAAKKARRQQRKNK